MFSQLSLRPQIRQSYRHISKNLNKVQTQVQSNMNCSADLIKAIVGSVMWHFAEPSFSHAAAGSGCWVLPQCTSNSPLYCLQEVSWSRAQTFDQN